MRKLLLLLAISGLCINSACQKQESITNSSSTLRISSEGDPQSVDPRRVRDLSTVTLMHMLYEGLVRNSVTGLEPGIAESMNVSLDQKTYTFKLRQSAWSDGQAVTAQDFEQTWKSVLDPQFPCPNAYQLYVIQGAQEAKEGKISLDKVGILARDASTLVVQLKQPTPYFLQLAATHFYYPVHPSLRAQLVDKSVNGSTAITNGPFQVKQWKHHNELTAVPNPHYWDRQNVQLDQISLVTLDNPTAMELFQRKELDWTGSPLSTLPIDALVYLKTEGLLQVAPAAGTYWLRLNTEDSLLSSQKIRRALALSLNRAALVEHVLQGNQIPAGGIIPPALLQREPLFADHDLHAAQQLFREGVEELGMKVENLPSIAISYSSGERAHKIAQVAQQQWKENLGIECSLQGKEAKVYFDQLKKHDYQIGIGSFFADFRNPISFLEIFKLKENGTNNTQWEDPRYVSLLNRASRSRNNQEQVQLLKAAEKLLIKNMPVIPLFYSSYNYLKNPLVKGVYFSELGYLDFKHAYRDK